MRIDGNGDNDSWERLSKKLSDETDLLGMRIVPENLFRSWESKKAVIRKKDEDIIAYVSLWETEYPQWFELGTLWVDIIHRGRKISSDIFCECLDAQPENSGVFIITHEPRVIHLGTKFGFVEVSPEDWLLLPWEVTCAPCDRLSEEEKQSCPFRGTREGCTLLYIKKEQ